jgi:hypothetical protein
LTDVNEMLERTMAAWQSADVDGWLAMFTPEAKFFVPGATSVSGDHDAESVAPVARRLMRAQTSQSGLGVIETFVSSSGAVVLADQNVDRDGTTHHYHCMLLHELGQATDRFAFWWLMVHEYDAFDRAWT